MQYRRFGRTELQMPVFSCGGMRYQQSWNADDDYTAENQTNLEATIRRSLEVGMNHIETPHGDGTSEEQLGQILPKLPRDEMIVQTKVGPTEDPAEFVETFEQSMKRLRLDHVELLGLHGVNNRERLNWSLRPGGCLEKAFEFRKQGRIKHIGFSTHGPTDLIVDALKDGRFDYVNLHYYYVFQRNLPAIEEATRQDAGVFIISPNDKGGKLYEPSEKLAALTAPLVPMAFNDLWCLSDARIHTLSVGAARPTDFDAHLEALPFLETEEKLRGALDPIVERLGAEMAAMLGDDWAQSWQEGVPGWEKVPGEINVQEILRLHNFARAFDMVEYGKMRYNLLGKGDHWFPGNQAETVGELDLSACLNASPHAARIPQLLAETHELLKAEDVKRLQE
jgi:predicted aldo/keto reductase-like oxidoreductase